MTTHSLSSASLGRNDYGVTSIEYALIVGLIALTIIGVLADVGGTLTALYATVAGDLAL
jgi:Flp pilus assembly pilin Flp